MQYFEIDKLFSIKTLLIYRECFCIALKFINRLLLSFFALFDLMSQFTGDWICRDLTFFSDILISKGLEETPDLAGILTVWYCQWKLSL